MKTKNRIICVLAIIAMVASLVPVGFCDNEIMASFYVSTAGNDDNTGSKKAPFKTIERARREVLKHNKSMSGNIEVNIEKGRYFLDDTLSFGVEDSASNGFSVIYKGESPENTIISGGKQLTDWTLYDKSKNIWVSKAGNIKSRQLFVNGERRLRASSTIVPQLKDSDVPGDYETIGDNVFATYKNVTSVELIWIQSFSDLRSPITAVDGKIVRMTETHRFYNHTISSLGQPARVENAFELLDEPGEWYLDNSDGMVYYMPKSGEDVNSADIILPRLEKIIDIEGTKENHVNGITITGVSIKDGTWMGPSDLKYGYANFQAGFCREFDPLYYSGFIVPNVLVCYGDNINFTNNIFKNLGSAGIWMREGVRNSSIVGNEFTDISQNGIILSHVIGTGMSDDEMIRCDNVKIENNLVHNVGIEYLGSVGIFASWPSNSSISHNEVYDTPYTGISCGWGWLNFWPKKEEDNDRHPLPNENNKIIGNYVHDGMTLLRDGGGIYTLAEQPGLEIAENVVANMGNNECFSYYLDNGSRWINVHDNVSYNVDVVLYSKGADNKIYNNYFDDGYNNAGVIGDQHLGHSEYLQLPITTGHNNEIYDNTVVKTGYFPAKIVSNAGIEYDYLSMKLRGNKDENIAHGAKVYAFDADGNILKTVNGSDGGKAVDENLKTSMRAMGKKPWIAEGDIGQKRRLYKLNVSFDSKYTPDNVKIFVSPDGINYEDVTPEKIGTENEINLKDKIVRNFKIQLVTGNMAISEISAYADDFLNASKDEDALSGLQLVTFDDIQNHWAKSDIEYLGTLGIIKGTTDTTFDPESIINRAEWVTLLTRVKALQKSPYANVFSDVSKDDWFSDNIQAAKADNLLGFINGSEFMPKKAITRGEAAATLENIEFLPVDETDNAVAAVGDFKDINGEYVKSIGYVIANGIMNGVESGIFAPENNLTRGQAAAILKRVYSRIAK